MTTAEEVWDGAQLRSLLITDVVRLELLPREEAESSQGNLTSSKDKSSVLLLGSAQTAAQQDAGISTTPSQSSAEEPQTQTAGEHLV